jgi:hypothetical protein
LHFAALMSRLQTQVPRKGRGIIIGY